MLWRSTSSPTATLSYVCFLRPYSPSTCWYSLRTSRRSLICGASTFLRSVKASVMRCTIEAISPSACSLLESTPLAASDALSNLDFRSRYPATPRLASSCVKNWSKWRSRPRRICSVLPSRTNSARASASKCFCFLYTWVFSRSWVPYALNSSRVMNLLPLTSESADSLSSTSALAFPSAFSTASSSCSLLASLVAATKAVCRNMASLLSMRPPTHSSICARKPCACESMRSTSLVRRSTSSRERCGSYNSSCSLASFAVSCSISLGITVFTRWFRSLTSSSRWLSICSALALPVWFWFSACSLFPASSCRCRAWLKIMSCRRRFSPSLPSSSCCCLRADVASSKGANLSAVGPSVAFFFSRSIFMLSCFRSSSSVAISFLISPGRVGSARSLSTCLCTSLKLCWRALWSPWRSTNTSSCINSCGMGSGTRNLARYARLESWGRRCRAQCRMGYTTCFSPSASPRITCSRSSSSGGIVYLRMFRKVKSLFMRTSRSASRTSQPIASSITANTSTSSCSSSVGDLSSKSTRESFLRNGESLSFATMN
mmetsp:Transcript_53157/g.106619  ORF Transcript_53157/g.106619 Transcript_53157/m.106619 type:complete len:546 (-) Transcript_53157:97-1734(-)